MIEGSRFLRSLTVWLCVVRDFETINFQFSTRYICIYNIHI